MGSGPSQRLSATLALCSGVGQPSPHAQLSQPTVRFAEDTLLLPREDGESEEGQPEAPWPLPGGRQRLIRKDTPHYKKHFKISKLPQPEAVVALLQGTPPDSEGPVGAGGWHNGPHMSWAPRAEEEEEGEAEEEEDGAAAAAEEEKAAASAPSVKVGLAPHASPNPAGQAPWSTPLWVPGDSRRLAREVPVPSFSLSSAGWVLTQLQAPCWPCSPIPSPWQSPLLPRPLCLPWPLEGWLSWVPVFSMGCRALQQPRV